MITDIVSDSDRTYVVSLDGTIRIFRHNHTLPTEENNFLRCYNYHCRQNFAGECYSEECYDGCDKIVRKIEGEIEN